MENTELNSNNISSDVHHNVDCYAPVKLNIKFHGTQVPDVCNKYKVVFHHFSPHAHKCMQRDTYAHARKRERERGNKERYQIKQRARE